jgi:hypothetical protein
MRALAECWAPKLNFIPLRPFSRAGHLRPDVSSQSSGRFSSISELVACARILALGRSNSARNPRSAMTRPRGVFCPSIGSTSPVRFLPNSES